MNKYVEIKSDITPENLESQGARGTRTKWRQSKCAPCSRATGSILPRSAPPTWSAAQGLAAPFPPMDLSGRDPKPFTQEARCFPRTPAQEAVQRIIDIRRRAFLKR